MFIKYLFIFFAVILAFMIIFYKLYLKKKTKKTANYVSVLTFVFFIYILSAFVLVFILKGTLNKAMILLFAFSPFIIGKFAVYKKEGLYSFIQVVCVILSAFFMYGVSL